LPPMKQMGLGSPRDAGEAYMRPTISNADMDERPFSLGPSLSPSQPHRNHRRGYFDLISPEAPSALRKTPPGTPVDNVLEKEYFSLTNLSRSYSFPPVDGSRLPGMLSPHPIHQEREAGGGSEDSTPSISSPSTSSFSDEDSPALSPSLTDGDVPPSKGSPIHEVADYSSFVNQFCFFTGISETPDQDGVPIQRTHSESSIDDFFSSSQRSIDFRTSSFSSPPRTQSFDTATGVYMQRSGTATPTSKHHITSMVLAA